MSKVTKASDIPLVNVHNEEACAGRVCIIHSPTKHGMSEWPIIWRDDRAIFERICEHGVGHPDPDQLPFWEETNQVYQAVHSCDGCSVE